MSPIKLLKNKEIYVTYLSENPRVGAERGPVDSALGTIY